MFEPYHDHIFSWNNSLGEEKIETGSWLLKRIRESVRLWLMTRSPVWCRHLLELEGIWLREIIKSWLLIYIYIWLLHILYNNIFGIWLRKIIKSWLLIYMYMWLLILYVDKYVNHPFFYAWNIQSKANRYQTQTSIKECLNISR